MTAAVQNGVAREGIAGDHIFMGTNPVIDARDLVAELFPQVRWAVLNGSMRPSAGSDLDIMVLLPDGDPRASRHDARRFRGRPVELYLHDEQTLEHQIAWELGARKPFLYRIVTTGATIAGDPFVWRRQSITTRSRMSAPARRRPSSRGAWRSWTARATSSAYPIGYCRQQLARSKGKVSRGLTRTYTETATVHPG